MIPKTADHIAAISYAENITQQPMNPFEEFDAYAAMLGEGCHRGRPKRRQLGAEAARC